MIGNPLLLPDEGYNISRSVRLRASASGYFTRTISSASTSTTTFTWSGWVKRGALGTARAIIAYHGNTAGNGNMLDMEFASDALRLFFDGSGSTGLLTSAVYRDPSAWYHIVLSYDSTQATSTNRAKLYVNGVQVTAFSSATYPALNQAINAGSGNVQNIGTGVTAPINVLDGYLTEINFIDGQALTPSSFGETDSITGVWKPKKYTGTYGTNGFFLNFSDNSNNTAATIGKDYSGNGNNWTPNNISVTSGSTYDSMLDVPTQWADGGNGRGNYAVMSPLGGGAGAAQANILSNANLTTSGAITGGVTSSMTVSGLVYAECTLAVVGQQIFGLCSASRTLAAVDFGTDLGHYGFYMNPAANYINGSSNPWNAGARSANDVIQIAVDASNPASVKLWMGINNVWYNSTGGTTGDPANGLNPTQTITANVPLVVLSAQRSGASGTGHINFGQRPFSYTPPSGFKALNTLNLPAPTILKGNQYFDALTWSGAGGSSRSITGLAFQPDLVWGKVRNTTYGHMLFDSARGAGSLKELGTNVTGAEGYASSNQYGYLSAFNSDGFTVTAGTDASIPNAYWNQSGNNYVGWQWKEGATQGFDIVTYTGTGVNRTVSHSLGVAPSMMIVKNRSTTDGWLIYHQSIGNTNFLDFTTAASSAATGAWNNTSPTSSVFTVGTSSRGNGSGNSIVAYLFSEVAGFSRFGSYTGNGSSDGPFVFCGFRPRWVMWKRTDVADNWNLMDTARNAFNLTNSPLYPNLSNAEGSGNGIDILSNGFKVRDSGTPLNANGGTYLFAAFSEHPFKNALAR
jgi:hypothetical protein